MVESEPHSEEIAFAGVRVEELSEHLFLSSRSAARKVFTSFSEESLGTQRRAAVEIGASLEYLSRAVVASWNPGLLALGSSTPSLLALSNVFKTNNLDHTSLKTIKTEDVQSLIAARSQPFARLGTEYKYVMAVRNAAAHMGLTDSASRRQATAYLVRIVSELLPLIGRSKQEFWGTLNRGLADAIEQQYTDEIAIRVESLMLTAQRRFRQLTSSLSDESREATLTLLESRPPRGFIIDSTQDQKVECPACGRRGLLTMVAERDVAAAEVSFDRSGDPQVLAPVRGTPVLFQCPVCELVLEDDELDRVPGLGDVRALKSEYIDIQDYVALREAQA